MSPVPQRSRAPLRAAEVTCLLTLVAGLVYMIGFRPVADRADRLDQPLRQAWESFAATNQSSAATAGVPADRLGERLKQLEAASHALSGLRQVAFERVALPTNVLDQVRAPFQLIDFDNERQQLGERLSALAKTKKITLHPAALSGLPAYPAESAPSLLWPRLHFASHILLAAIHCEVREIVELTQLPPISHRSPVDGSRLFEEMPMRVTLTGGMDPLARFLTTLPLRDAELEATRLAGVISNKPSLFVSHILARKAAPERPHDAQLEVVVSGFVPATGRPTGLTAGLR